jgi:hypothetical protein
MQVAVYQITHFKMDRLRQERQSQTFENEIVSVTEKEGKRMRVIERYWKIISKTLFFISFSL